MLKKQNDVNHALAHLNLDKYWAMFADSKPGTLPHTCTVTFRSVDLSFYRTFPDEDFDGFKSAGDDYATMHMEIRNLRQVTAIRV